jgi:hypothetical protein
MLQWRRLGRVGAAGVAIGVAGVLAGLFSGRSSMAAVDLAFAVAALGLGFGLTTWASMAMVGDALEEMADRLDVSEDFSAAGSRAAMSVVTAVSAGAMIGATVAGVLLRAL